MAAREAPDRRAERVRELLDQREVLARAQAAAAGHHDRGLGQLRPLAALGHDLAGHLRGLGRVAEIGSCTGSSSAGPAAGLRRDGVRPDRDDRRAGPDLGLDRDRTAEDRLLADQAFATARR